MPDETKEIEAICGPYRGQRLTVTAADAAAAIAANWAIDPFAPVLEPPPDPLTEEERTAALAAAQAWATEQQKAASGEDEETPPPDPEGGTRGMRAEPASRPYKTRGR